MSKLRIVHSKISSNRATMLPRAVCEYLHLKPGDRLRYVFDDGRVRMERSASNEEDLAFATFTEWASKADEKAYADL